MNILVLNCGSSSVKFVLISLPSRELILKGQIEKISTECAIFKVSNEQQKSSRECGPMDQAQALRFLLVDYFKGEMSQLEIHSIGHRVVHGAEKFSASCLIDQAVLDAIRSCNHLAPLHNPANLIGIELAIECFPGLPQVAVFDTAFHHTLPPKAYRYAIPNEWYTELGIRRYGFHGSSHRYVSAEYARISNENPDDLQIIIVHLGNGSSATAVKNGKSMDTTMGLTPLEGLVMGTRSGDIDPGIFSFLHETKGWSLDSIHQALNKKSGLLGLSGLSSDMQELEANMNLPQVQLTLEVLCYRMAKSILSLCAALDRLDAIVFTGGIGENSNRVRQMCVDHLKVLGIELDEKLNLKNGKNNQGIISKGHSTPVAVVPTNEELMIALDTLALI
jgi:acetate kinase